MKYQQGVSFPLGRNMKLSFIGLGNMGAPMARNLASAGHDLTVFNRTRSKAEAIGGPGVRIADSPAAAARESDAVFTMLADDHALAEVVFGGDGILAGLKEGSLHVSSSTISTGFARKLTEQHRAAGQVFLSAPVFGRPKAAEQRKLIVVAAGDPQQLARLQPAFDAIGRRTFQIGSEPWQANAVKLCGNFMIASMLESFGETFAVMRKSEIDPRLFLDVMNELFGSPVYRNYGAAVAEEKFEPAGFLLKLGLKDIRLAMEAAHERGVPMPFASVIRDHLVSAIANGQEQLDWSSLALVSARAAGLETGARRPASQAANR
jgi:3-hydroxyisobutyrate dehydrogenase-like beta-hydroxyacid dehydrogenase